MRGEHQPGVVAQLLGQALRRVSDRLGEHLHEQRMVEVLPQLDQFGCALTGRLAAPGDVLDVLRAAGIATPRRRGEHRRPTNAVVAHGRNRILDVGLPVAVAEIHRQVEAGFGQLGLQLLDQCAVDAVDR